MITYIFKVVINFFQNAGVKVQNLELSGINYFTLSYKQVITQHAGNKFIIMNFSHHDPALAVLAKQAERIEKKL